MALYQPVQSWMKASETVKIVGTEQGDGFTVYRVQVTYSPLLLGGQAQVQRLQGTPQQASAQLPRGAESAAAGQAPGSPGGQLRAAATGRAGALPRDAGAPLRRCTATPPGTLSAL
ncbi:hypothetical protein MTO96_008132 [Rhipicephalus appendiculatus]